MAGRVAGKVAFITGAARGQGRSHAVRLAQEGADIIAVDFCNDIDTVPIAMPTPEDLQETVRQVEALDRRIIAEIADVRDQEALDAVVARGLAELGHIDIVCGNAGIFTPGSTWELDEYAWQTMIDINLTGVWHTVKAVVPHMIEAGRGGSIVLTSSFSGEHGIAHTAHYTAAKHGVLGLMRTLANEVGSHMIRVNAIMPCNVGTDMILNDMTYRLYRPDLDNPGKQDFEELAKTMFVLPIPYVEPVDISNAVLWLASEEARYVTGVALPVDAGWNAKT
jgi:SDR family mycofactocin-dependent oxidoreductase